VEKLDLTAGFLQAIADFSKVEVGQDLETISMSNSRYYFAQKQGYFFVLIDEQNSSRTKEQAGVLLDSLYRRFFKECPSAARKWNGDRSTFKSFGPACDEVM